MKKLFLILFTFVTIIACSQSVTVTGTVFTIRHGDLTLYLDKDTASFVSVQMIANGKIDSLTGVRSNKWHKESPKGPYSKEAYLHTGYDLGHLTPSEITSYNDTLNYHSFSLFNQAPQLAAFNRGKWAQLEAKVVQMIKERKTNAVVITGVIYDTRHKEFLGTSRIKIPIMYYKILIFNPKEVYDWIGSNENGLITDTDTQTILDLAAKNGDSLGFIMHP